MKLNKWLLGAMAFSLLTACSDNDLASIDTPTGGHLSSGTVSYLGVSLELPSEPATRGVNDNFEDGTANEYQVDHAAILLFQGENESGSRFIGAYQLGTDQAFDQPNKDQITVSFQKTIKVLDKPVLGPNEKMWGLAIVNYSDDIFKISTNVEESEDYGDLVVRTKEGDNSVEKDLIRISEADETNEATTFGEFRKYITDSKFVRTNGGFFFMTNAPLSSVPSVTSGNFTGEIQTLAQLKNNFEKTETEAIQNPAGCIFVERAVAKITLGAFPSSAQVSSTTVTLGDDGVPTYKTETVNLPIEGVEWCLDNEETTSYIVRNAEKSHPFWAWSRFIGTKGMNDNIYDSDPVHQESTQTLYRTYWCEDPAYSINKTFNNQTVAEDAFQPAVQFFNSASLLTSTPIYCRENTFDVNHQNYKNTTRVIFKVKYGNSSDIYIVRGQLQTMYLETAAQNLLKRSVLGSMRLHNMILAYKKDELTKIDYKETDFDIAFGNAENADSDNGIVIGDYIITSISFKDDFINKNFKSLTAEDKADIANEFAGIAKSANQANHIVPFDGNTCYYAVYLKHFGDTYCPLPEEWSGNLVKPVYNQDNAKYLGRYGLVRNNWYELEVGDITRLGNPTVPNGNSETSDDNRTEDWFLSARVHVLSWAKRTQQVDF